VAAAQRHAVDKIVELQLDGPCGEHPRDSGGLMRLGVGDGGQLPSAPWSRIEVGLRDVGGPRVVASFGSVDFD
jgi:hypothetical protein